MFDTTFRVLTQYRDSSARLTFALVSTSNYANRHSLRITWSKAQDVTVLSLPPHIEYNPLPKSQAFTMTAISTPDTKQSEAYIATVALFVIFGSSSREDKVVLRLPATWRDLWTEFANEKKEKADELDRESIRTLRDMVREKKDQELEDGVLLKGAFKGRGASRTIDNGGESMTDNASRSSLTPEAYQKIWWEKSNTPSYQYMLVS